MEIRKSTQEYSYIPKGIGHVLPLWESLSEQMPSKELAEEAGELVEKSALEEPTNKELIRSLYLILTIEINLFDG